MTKPLHHPPAFLGVESSLTGRFWAGPDPATERRAEGIAQQSGLPLQIARILAERGIDAAEAEGYLEPRLRDLMPDPRTMRDMEKAAARLLHAALTKQRIAIFADYDVDGAVSAALLILWLRKLGHEATLYVPDRIAEGYGPNAKAIAHLAADHDLIICVDCGTMAHEALAVAEGRADVIILDHHLGGEELPPALAVVNPNRADETGDLGYLCAGGVVFMALVEANRQARDTGAGAVPDLIGMLDLVALATVADMAPLVGLNRAFVRQGLAIMARRDNIGLTALADVARLDTAPTAFHLGFLIGPRINAGGRIGTADLGARCLIADDPEEARTLAAELDALNEKRRADEAALREAALLQAQGRDMGALAWAAGEGWHPGIVGIIASRLKEASNLPSVVIGIADGVGKGSARSVPGVDLGRAVQTLVNEGLLITGGGHEMAAGLSVAEEQIEAAMARLDALLAPALAAAPGRNMLRISGLLANEGATAEFWDLIECAGPFGAASPAPRYVFADQTLRNVATMGDGRHLRLDFSAMGGKRMQAVAWGAMEGPLGEALIGMTGQQVHLAGRLEMSHWQGRANLRLRLDDAALAG